MNKKITIISTGQPAGNPRLVKEADALSKFGFEVTVIYAHWANWAILYDQEIIKNSTWKAILAGGNLFFNKYFYLFSKIKHKIYSTLSNYTFRFLFAEKTQARAFRPLLSKAKQNKADLYIAHNLGALAIAAKAADFHQVKYAFDAEDFHRNETTDDIYSKDYLLKKYLEEKYFPNACYISAASPLISSAYIKLFPSKSFIEINNVFPFSTRKIMQNAAQKKLKLVWFSQTVGKNRGIEDVLKALKIIDSSEIEFYLVGVTNESIKKYFLEIYSAHFLPPIHPSELINFISQFDIGLALEQKTPLNRDICLTNKIFSYISAGLAIIASDTQAQKLFMDTNPKIGKVYQSANIQALANTINCYFTNKNELYRARNEALQLAENKYNTDIEYKKIIPLINKI